ncbi:MAG: 4-oxalocrotonate tautomerase family protein [Spirochaetes bacterium]|nr:4-oxalocrotonate tautomerase family protein [Spirochaetota bacterium]MBN2772234.1 4-oxalocrotonate tautomerase family protein [Spirochaetota bacterium]
MPIISVELGKGQANENQKREMIEKFTDDASRITGLGKEKFTILINELPKENIGVGGKMLKDLMPD